MLRSTVLICAMLALQWNSPAQAQANREAVRVQIVATASEYIPRSTTVSHPGHSYTNCMGSTSYFGRFSSYGDSGSFSGTADTDSRCSTTFSPPTETTLTTYRRVNYTIAKSDQALYLLSCTQTWKPTAKERVLLGVMGGLEAGSGNNSGNSDKVAAHAKGKWSECPAFSIGVQYTLTVRNTSDARLEGGSGKPSKLEYLSSAPLPEPTAESAPTRQSQAANTPLREAKVHVTSSPSGGEIYIDGKFFGNTPSDITLTLGEHVVKVTLSGKEWSRTVQITAGAIRLHAEMAEP
jgi:hypothetical protein